MSNPKEDVTLQPLRLNHSALGGYGMPAYLEGEPVQVVAPRATQQAPEPLQPIDPKAHEPLKPGSKVE